MRLSRFVTLGLILLVPIASACRKAQQEIERPERIVSLREVVYDSTTYAKLARLWESYYDAYPSEDAYANWMYAARYAEFPDYESMLKKGVEKYPANPRLLYLLGMSKKEEENHVEGRHLMESAAALDRAYMDPWYGLTVEYIVHGDRENADVALRHLLEGKAVEDVVMDLSYNMLASVDTNAILITNGDNDTYPGWILTRIVRFRSDVNIVNMSLLNVDAYQSSIVKEGVPEFITQAGLDSLKTQVAAERDEYKTGKLPVKDVQPLGERLVFRIIHAAERVGRPVYFACTLNNFRLLKQAVPQARGLGLVLRVTDSTTPYPAQLQRLFTVWGRTFRTGGLDSWQLHSAGPNDAGRYLTRNYAGAFYGLMPQMVSEPPEIQLSMFRWYRDHLMGLLDRNTADQLNSKWFDRRFPAEIREWSRSKGWLGD